MFQWEHRRDTIRWRVYGAAYGVVGFVDEIEGETQFPAGSMSLALGGSFLGSCFIQKKPFYTAQNVAVLQEKIPLSDHVKLIYCDANS